MASLSYKFSNLLGVTYAGGSLAFTEDGNGLLSSAGNRVIYKDLLNQQSFALGIEAVQDIDHIVTCPQQENSRLASAIIIDTAGHVILLNVKSLVSLARFSMKARVSAVAVSPCGRYVAFGAQKNVSCWEVPCEKNHWNFSRIFHQQGHTERINSIQWSLDKLTFLTSSNDCTVKVWAVNPSSEFVPLTFIDHHRGVRFAAFNQDASEIVSVSTDGSRIIWQWQFDENDEAVQRARNLSRQRLEQRREERYRQMIAEKFGTKEEILNEVKLEEPASKRLRAGDPESDVTNFLSGKWILLSRDLIEKEPYQTITACAYDCHRDLLVSAISSGLVEIREKGRVVDDGRISFGNTPIESIALNADAEWIAIGSSESGLLAVWEWLSGTYVLKDFGDRCGSRSVALMPAGILDPFSKKASQDRMIGTASRNIVATGSIAGEVKLWDSNSGRSFASFHAHDGPISGLAFTPQMNAVVSAGQDGSVKAFDLLKGQCFRTMEAVATSLGVAPQLSSLAIDPSGEIIVGSSMGSDCRVFLWSLQTGRLLDTLNGPEQPISKIAFSTDINNPGQLAASSLDGSAYLWDIFGRAKKVQILKGEQGAVTLAFDPRGNGLLAVSHFAGHIAFWDVENEETVGLIDGRRDIEIGRSKDQYFRADNSRKLFDSSSIPLSRDADPDAHFNSICFTGQGQYLVAAAKNSAKICIYSTGNYQLTYAFKLTHNRSIDGLQRILNSKFVTADGVNTATIDLSDDELLDSTISYRKRRLEADKLPGANLGEAANEAERRKLKVWDIQSSSDERQLVVATSHGVFCYAIDHQSITSSSSVVKNHVLYNHLNSFAPVALSEETTRENILSNLKAGNFLTALKLSLAMNSLPLITKVYIKLNPQEISLMVKSLDSRLISPLLNFIRCCLSPHLLKDDTHRQQIAPAVSLIEVHLTWLVHILSQVEEKEPLESKPSRKWQVAGDAFANVSRESQKHQIRTLLLMILKQIQEQKELLTTLFESNKHLASFLCHTLSQ